MIGHAFSQPSTAGESCPPRSAVWHNPQADRGAKLRCMNNKPAPAHSFAHSPVSVGAALLSALRRMPSPGREALSPIARSLEQAHERR